MTLEPRRVLIFRQVARAGSISAAARALGWTQPAVSQHLARLEREAGGALLLRGPGGVTPTEAGTSLLRRADAVAAELHAAAEELVAFTDLRSGRVRMASFPSASATVVPDAVGALARDHPGIEVSLEEAEPPEAMAAVTAGDVDLALVFGYDGPPEGVGSLSWRPLFDEPVHLVVPRRAERSRSHDLTALAESDWIGGCPRCRSHLVACCQAAGFTPTVRYTSDDYVVVQNLVARGLGVTMLPDSALSTYRHPDVRIVALAGLGRRHVGLAYRSGADTVPATAALLQRLRAVTAERRRRARSGRVTPPGVAAEEPSVGT